MGAFRFKTAHMPKDETGRIDLSAERNKNRPVSAQRLPIACAAPQPRAFPGALRPAAAFLTQLLSARSTAQSREADSTYREIEKSDIKRVPPGLRRNLSA